MAVIFSKSSHLNDDFWKDTDVALKAVMQDVDSEKNKDDELVKKLYTVEKSTRFGEKTSGLTSFSNFDIVGEGDSAVLDSVQEGFPKLIVHCEFMKKFICTKTMVEDSSLNEARIASANFIRSYKRSRAEFASRALSAQGKAFLYSGATLDRTTGDGEGLFSVAHKGKKSSVENQANVFTNAFGADTSILNRLANAGRNFKNDSGIVTGYTFDTIVIPSNTPALEDTIRRIIRTDLSVGSNLNDTNTQKGLWNLVIDHHWQAPTGKAPYILMSSDANKETRGNMFFDRVGLSVIHAVEINTQNLEWVGRCRFSAGFNNWRQVIMGGADAGITLT